LSNRREWKESINTPNPLLQKREYFPGFEKSKSFTSPLCEKKKDLFSSRQPCKDRINFFLEYALPAATFHRTRGL